MEINENWNETSYVIYEGNTLYLLLSHDLFDD
jgi:hypothetical protein